MFGPDSGDKDDGDDYDDDDDDDEQVTGWPPPLEPVSSLSHPLSVSPCLSIYLKPTTAADGRETR